MPEISPKAIVNNPDALAEDVRVGPFSFVGPDVSVETGTVIGSNVTILGSTRIGPDCRLFPGCVIGTPPEGLTAKQAGHCTVETGNIIREHVIIESGASADGPGTAVGKGNLLMVGCHVGHDAVLAGQGIFANFTRIKHHCHIEEFVQTGGFTDVLAYTTVGAYTFTTGYASIDRDAPPYARVQGIPFRVRGVNTTKLQRCGFDPEMIETLKQAFRTLFNGQADSPTTEQLDSVEASLMGEHVDHLVASLRRSAASPTGRQLEADRKA